MDQAQFEGLLDAVSRRLARAARRQRFNGSTELEQAVREALRDSGDGQLKVDFDPHPHAFPDICLGKYGIEVKFTAKDTWRSKIGIPYEEFHRSPPNGRCDSSASTREVA